MSIKEILDSVFEGNSLTTIVYNDKVMWFAPEISRALGYKNTRKVSNLIRQEWSDEFIEGEHFIVKNVSEFEGPYYGPSKDRAELENTSYVFSKARRVMLLTEPGVDLVILKTRKAAGKRLRYHLSRVVLPQFRREMIEERPMEELEARYRDEISSLKDKIIKRDELIIERDNLLIEQGRELGKAKYRLGVSDGAVDHVRKSASLAGASLQACKGTKRLRDMN